MGLRGVEEGSGGSVSKFARELVADDLGSEALHARHCQE
jgi:hypothetical protein